MRAIVISVGTELLIGTTLNTHGQFLSQTLNAVGISVLMHISVGDNPARIQSALEFAEGHGDLIILTGGLGPTLDDLTRYALADHLKLKILRDQGSGDHIASFFNSVNRPMTENNLRQCDFPEGAILLENHRGTARGFLLNHGAKRYVALPGPPRELSFMVEKELLPHLSTKGAVIHSKFVRVFGIGESQLETSITDLIELQGDVSLAPYVGTDDLALRLTAAKQSTEEAEIAMAPLLESLKARIGHYIFSTENESLAEAVLSTLQQEGYTLSLAESCTGGLTSSKLTRVPGASQVVHQALVTYSNDAKIQHLNLSAKILEQHGAVSQETATAMLAGLKAISGSDCGIAITGIAGPDGGSEEKPVGTVYIGIYTPNRQIVRHFKLWGDRERIQNRAANSALFMLYKLLKNAEMDLENL